MTPSHNLIQELEPRLPLELLDLVIKFAPAETYANLALCNRRLYRTCNPLLYRTVYLYTPMQLTKLYESEKARSMLETTEALFVDESVLFNETWEDIHTDVEPVEYFIRVLQTTVSLRRLQVLKARAAEFQWKLNKSDFCNAFGTRFYCLLNETESFLPKLDCLSVVESTEEHGFHDYPPNTRSFGFFSILDSTELSVNVVNIDCLSTGYIRDSTSIKTHSGIQGRSLRSISASDVGLFIRETISADTSPDPIKSLCIIAQFTKDPASNNLLSVDDALLWTQNALSATSCSHVETLYILFVPLSREPSLDTQYSVLQELQKSLSALTTVTFSSWNTEWSRQTLAKDTSCASPSLPVWTPQPFDPRPEKLMWWINALALEVPRTQDCKMLEETARKLREAMLTRWGHKGHNSVPPEGWLCAQLAHVQELVSCFVRLK